LFKQRHQLTYNSEGYDAPIIDSTFEFIVEKTNTIREFSNVAIKELERRKSSNLDITLANFDLKGNIKDLTYEIKVVSDFLEIIKEFDDESIRMKANDVRLCQYDSLVKRCSILDEDPYVFGNNNFLPEVSFLFIEP
jgi:hypothetical protein